MVSILVFTSAVPEVEGRAGPVIIIHSEIKIPIPTVDP